MKAVILVGGEGTRLRPLTYSVPKPLMPLVNRPFLDHVLNLLREHGITEVVLAVSYRSESFEQAYGSGEHLGVHLTYVREEVAMGTGGAIKNVQSYLTPGETFLVFNGDILTDLDLTAMLRYHRETGSICTISLTPVQDPSQYGVVDMDQSGRILRFTEKPPREEATSDWINAGTYILEPEILGYIPARQHYMVEHGLFPTLLAEGKPLYGYRSKAYWLDIGTPAKYLQANADLLNGRLKSALQPQGEELSTGIWAGEGAFIEAAARITGPAVLGEGCKIRAGANIAGPVVLGDNCQVEEEARLQDMVGWDEVIFRPRSQSRNCILASHVEVGSNSLVEGISVVGHNATIGAGNRVTDGARLEPGTALPDVEAKDKR